MEFETLPPSPATPTLAHRIFLNDRGIRAGWRLAIFVSMLTIVFGGLNLALRYLQELGKRAGAPSASAPPAGFAFPIAQAIGELFFFLIVFFFTWIMSRIERRQMGAYGLPLTRSAVPRFIVGYIFWGFLPLTVLLLVMRLMGAFYFGSLNLHGISILTWGLAWGVGFLMVGFAEEYTFRGYALYTLAEGIGFWPAALVLGIGFAATHMGNSGETHVGIIGIVAFALFAAATLRRTGSLWLIVGAHAGWDWGQSFFYGVNDSGFQAPGHLLNPRTAGPAWLSGGTVGPEGSVLCMVIWTVMLVIFLAIYKGDQNSSVTGTFQSPPSQEPAAL